MNNNPAVVFDACVLYPAPLRDLLLELAGLSQDRGWFRVNWTEKFTARGYVNSWRGECLSVAQFDRTRAFMNNHIARLLVTPAQSAS